MSIDVDVDESINDNENPVISSLSATRQKDSRSIVAAWSATDNIGIDKYFIELHDSTDTLKASANLTGDTTTYTFENLTDGSYYVKLTAYDQNENSASKTTDSTNCRWKYNVKITL